MNLSGAARQPSLSNSKRRGTSASKPPPPARGFDGSLGGAAASSYPRIVDPWNRTLQDRWDDFERFFEVDWTADEPGARLIETVEALVDEWWSVAAETIADEMKRRPRLKRVIAVCDFDQRVPDEIRDRLYGIAEGTES